MDDRNPRLESGSAPSPAYSPPQPAPPIVHRIFLDRDGLRVPWRILWYLIMAFMVLEIETFLWFPSSSGILWQELASKVEAAIAVILPAFVMAAVEKRPFGSYGLAGRQAFGRRFWEGAFWGIGALTLLLAIMWLAHLVDFGGLALHGIRIEKFGVFYALLFLAVGLFEEFLVRGYVQFTLAKGIGFWPAAILSSVAFGAIHLGNKGEDWIGLATVVLIGLFLCQTLYRTGTLWWAVGFHCAWDWGQTYLYSVPDSGASLPGHLMKTSFHGEWWLTGGAVGPEGSVLVLVLIGAVWIAFSGLHPKRNWTGD